MTDVRGVRRPRLGFVGLGRIGRLRLQSLVRANVADVVALADCSPAMCEYARSLAPEAAVVAGDLAGLLEAMDTAHGRSGADAYVADSVFDAAAGRSAGAGVVEAGAGAGAVADPHDSALDLDGVVIATPSAGHATEATLALSRGLAVFCQKPLGRTAAEVCLALEAARSADRLLGVDLSYRRTQAMAAVAAILRQRGIGDVYAAELTFHNAYGPDRDWFYDIQRSGGGCLIDLGTHLVDLLLWTMGDARPVRDVSGRLYAGGRQIEPPLSTVEDFATLRIDLVDGTTATINCSWGLPAGRDAVIECRWFGTTGGLRFANVNGSFFDFVAERFDGTRTATLVDPPDDWGGRTLVAWAKQLAAGQGYDPDVESILEVAQVLDCAYGR